ncbi:MAG: alpha/beta fold hydrolase [Nocardioidaceae bacterium]|nr:alpha/beta fold hydrolase [Nocardioidaceae bacterium]
MARRLVLGLFLLFVSACGNSPGATRPAAPPPTSAAPWTTPAGALGRCGPQPPAVAATRFDYRALSSPAVGKIPAVTAGSGDTVAVLLHQTDGGGLCGWLPFAGLVAADPGITVIAVDLCSYGAARCRAAQGDAAQTRAASLAIDLAVRTLHARRVVVVGASMGGSVALMTAVRDRRVDAVADLSGPVDWRGMRLVREGRALPVPALVSMAEDEDAAQVAGAKAIVANAPQGSRFLPAAQGHGYELVTQADGRPGALFADVLAWIRG